MTREAAVFRLHADCVFVPGAKNAAIYDLTRRRIVSVPAAYGRAYESIDGRYSQADIERDEREEGDGRRLAGFVRYLIAEEMGDFIDDPARFPRIEPGWEAPGEVQNAIVDVDAHRHDFASIFAQLDRLGCEYAQIRCYSDVLEIEEIHAIGRAASHTSIRGVELMLPESAKYPDAALEDLVRSELIFVRVVVHSASEDRTLGVAFGDSVGEGISEVRTIHMLRARLRSSDDCGRIGQASLQPPDVPLFEELKRYNGCLNGKIAIDAEGRIKNCPSLPTAYGRVDTMPLAEALNAPGFRSLWSIAKDSIAVCRDCEYRYACTDCRAFRSDPDDLHSKPAKCGYDPYTGRWDLRIDDPTPVTPGFAHVRPNPT